MSKTKLTIRQPFHNIKNNIIVDDNDIIIDHDNRTIELFLTYAQEKRVTCQYDCSCGVLLDGNMGCIGYMLFIERKGQE